ncbi:hypothetical protein ED208_02105 [Stagnimonas aquatica]|uniref:Uncharacterized protein n=1 Tax=Stagnimonas aquatica TaxID=2689987 RepID=A0A3N0VMW5_9GAMM|nr:hypothetical protein ED208_02105 [Stagnimonas aquatica]
MHHGFDDEWVLRKCCSEQTDCLVIAGLDTKLHVFDNESALIRVAAYLELNSDSKSVVPQCLLQDDLLNLGPC